MWGTFVESDELSSLNPHGGLAGNDVLARGLLLLAAMVGPMIIGAGVTVYVRLRHPNQRGMAFPIFMVSLGTIIVVAAIVNALNKVDAATMSTVTSPFYVLFGNNSWIPFVIIYYLLTLNVSLVSALPFFYVLEVCQCAERGVFFTTKSSCV